MNTLSFFQLLLKNDGKCIICQRTFESSVDLIYNSMNYFVSVRRLLHLKAAKYNQGTTNLRPEGNWMNLLSHAN